MPRRKNSAIISEKDTRIKIVETATKLFALKGFRAVTLHDIARAVDIKIASIYYYYKDKDALINDVIMRYEEIYKEYHDWLCKMNEKAETLEDVMENLFNKELFETLNPISRMGMSMTIREQHNNAYAHKSVFKHIYDGSIMNIKAGFDRLIEKNIIPPSDTKTLATLMMFCVMAGNELYLHNFSEDNSPIDGKEIYKGLEKLVRTALAQGILETT